MDHGPRPPALPIRTDGPHQTCPSLYNPVGSALPCLWCNGGVDRAELVGRLFLAYQSRDLEELGELVAPDVRVEPLSTALLPGHAYRGLDGITRWLDELADSGYEFHPDIDGMEVHGDRVLVAGTVRATSIHQPPSTTAVAWVFEFRADDRLRTMCAYLSVDDARTQLPGYRYAARSRRWPS
jgi:ketosteroid isomerase-like protein